MLTLRTGPQPRRFRLSCIRSSSSSTGLLASMMGMQLSVRFSHMVMYHNIKSTCVFLGESVVVIPCTLICRSYRCCPGSDLSCEHAVFCLGSQSPSLDIFASLVSQAGSYCPSSTEDSLSLFVGKWNTHIDHLWLILLPFANCGAKVYMRCPAQLMYEWVCTALRGVTPLFSCGQ